MKTKQFIHALMLSFIGLFLISASFTAVMATSGETEQIQPAPQDPPPPPKTVSPKNPDTKAPVPALTCPHCGKQIPSRWGKGAKARPRLGAGQARQERLVQGRHQECLVPGRQGIQGRYGRHEHMVGHRARPGKMGHRGAGRPAKPGQFAMLLRHADILGLTEAQQTKLKELKFAAEKEMIDLKAAVQKEKLELRQLLREKDLNARSIKRQLEAVAQAQTNLRFHKVSMRIEARDILTDEQKELLKEKLHCYQGSHRMGHCIQDPDVAPEQEMHLEED